MLPIVLAVASSFLYQPVSAPTLHGKPLTSNMPVIASPLPSGVTYK